ncbi:MAG: transporter substrate-binding domain-containing protein [Leptospiraceae bacterium]|nr:transporter substrate-binding domain-containing protein [Leptospiraceae bacterium]
MKHLFFLFLFLSFSVLAKEEESNLFKILKKGSLIVSLGDDQPYYIYNPKPDYPGFEVELAEKYAEFLGVKLEKVIPLKNFSEHAEYVKAGKVDIAIGNSFNAARMKHVYFSEPYIVSTIGVLVNKNILPQETEGDVVTGRVLRNLMDLRNLTRVSFGVRDKTFNTDYIRSAFSQYPIQTYESDQLALAALKENRFTCYVADSLYIEGLLQRDKSLLGRFTPLLGQNVEKQLSFAVKKYDLQLIYNINLFIREMKRTGEIQKLKEKYFNSNKWVND